MHIVYVSADQGIPVFGCKGASVHIQEVVRALVAQGNTVTILSPRLEGKPPPDLQHLRCIALPHLKEKDATRRARLAIDTNEVITKILLSLEPFDLIYERHSLFVHAPMSVAMYAGVPGVLEVNAPLIEEQARHRQLPLAIEARAIASRSMQCARLVSTVSPAINRYAKELGAHPGRVHVIENGVNPQRFPQRPVPEGPFTVGFLGTLKPWHDVRTLIEGFVLLRQGGVDARLLIVGDGPERDSLEAQVQRVQIEEVVEFTGKQMPDEVPGQLARMHAAVASYRSDQPFYFSPLKIYEYMVAGLPVVASRVGHLDTVIRHGDNGLLCIPGDAADLASVLERLAGDADEARRLGHAARAHVIANHDWKHVASRVLQLACGDERMMVAS